MPYDVFSKFSAKAVQRVDGLWRSVLTAWVISWIVFACIVGGALFGMLLRTVLPGKHLGADAKDVIRLGTGLIGTIAALVLGLLIGSAKATFDTKSAQITHLTANAVLLDSLLAQYGPETHAARDLVRHGIVTMVERIWHENSPNVAKAQRFESSETSNEFSRSLQNLAPENDAKRSLRDTAIQTSNEFAKMRVLLFAEAQTDNSIPLPFLTVLVFWLTIIFASYSLFAQPNAIVVCCLLIFAFSAAAAIFLILELAHPFTGLMQISSEPLRYALAPLSP